jgi:hypothetical protein
VTIVFTIVKARLRATGRLKTVESNNRKAANLAHVKGRLESALIYVRLPILQGLLICGIDKQTALVGTVVILTKIQSKTTAARWRCIQPSVLGSAVTKSAPGATAYSRFAARS